MERPFSTFPLTKIVALSLHFVLLTFETKYQTECFTDTVNKKSFNQMLAITKLFYWATASNSNHQVSLTDQGIKREPLASFFNSFPLSCFAKCLFCSFCSCNVGPEITGVRPSEPILFPKSRIYFTKYNFCNPDEHVPDVERENRTLGEHFRTEYHRLTFNNLPLQLIRTLIVGCTFNHNLFVWKEDCSTYYSPRMIL